MEHVDPELGERDADLFAGVAVGAGLPLLTLWLLPEGGPLAMAVVVGCLIVGTYLMERSAGRRELGKGLIVGAGGLLFVGLLGWMLLGGLLSMAAGQS